MSGSASFNQHTVAEHVHVLEHRGLKLVVLGVKDSMPLDAVRGLADQFIEAAGADGDDPPRGLVIDVFNAQVREIVGVSVDMGDET